MTEAEIKTEVELRVQTQWGLIQQKQAQYFSAYKRYFQGLSTHSVTPEDGAEVAPDRASDKPHYQNESWLSLGGLPATTMSSLRMDTYDGPMGQGFVFSATVKIDGVTWERSWNSGPEQWRNSSWTEVQSL